MLEKHLLDIDEEEKSLLWEMFHYEKILDDNEECLQRDLEFYENRIRTIKKPTTPIEIGVMTIYMSHVRNLRNLLIKLHEAKNKCTDKHTLCTRNTD